MDYEYDSQSLNKWVTHCEQLSLRHAQLNAANDASWSRETEAVNSCCWSIVYGIRKKKRGRRGKEEKEEKEEEEEEEKKKTKKRRKRRRRRKTTTKNNN